MDRRKGGAAGQYLSQVHGWQERRVQGRTKEEKVGSKEERWTDGTDTQTKGERTDGHSACIVETAETKKKEGREPP
jgi:hypothetical protein